MYIKIKYKCDENEENEENGERKWVQVFLIILQFLVLNYQLQP